MMNGLEYKKLLQQKNQLSQEKKIAVEFMHNLAEAIGEGVERKVLYQRIVHSQLPTSTTTNHVSRNEILIEDDVDESTLLIALVSQWHNCVMNLWQSSDGISSST